VRRQRRPRLLVIDEAWTLLRYPEGGAFLSAMARRARKYYLGLVTISQLVADFVDDPHGKAVFQNAPMKLVLKQDSDGIDRAADVLKLTEAERKLLLGAGKGEGLLFARGGRLHITVQASQAEHRLATTAPSETAGLGFPADPQRSAGVPLGTAAAGVPVDGSTRLGSAA
jgi:conjugal transfer ATP-binding protein TraC